MLAWADLGLTQGVLAAGGLLYGQGDGQHGIGPAVHQPAIPFRLKGLFYGDANYGLCRHAAKRH
jgi:hypothetical protein